MTATLADNQATARLKEQLAGGASVTIRMSDYGGFEKVGALPWSLPASNHQITTVPGDIMLYQGNNIVFFYGSNSWAYTPLGKFDIADASALKSFFGSGEVSVTLSLAPSSAINEVQSADGKTSAAFDITGRPVDPNGDLPSGIYIINGKKRVIK